MTFDYRSNVVEALANGLRAIEAFEKGGRNLTLSDVALRAGLSRATARRYLHTLCALGYAEHDGKYFRLTPRVLKLGYVFISTAPLPNLAQPILEHIGAATGRSAFLGVLDGLDVVFLAVFLSTSTPRPARALVGVGGRLPAFGSATGRVLLAAKPDSEVEKLITRARQPRRVTLHTKTKAEDLLVEIRRVRTAGYAAVDKEVDLATRSIAVPVISGAGDVVAAISVTFPSSDTSIQQLVEQTLPTLSSASRALGAML